jgi:hypothetical protein
MLNQIQQCSLTPMGLTQAQLLEALLADRQAHLSEDLSVPD